MQLALSVVHILIQEVIQSLVTTVCQRKKINLIIECQRRLIGFVL